MKEKLSYTPGEFAKLMGVSDGAVRDWLRKGKIPGAYQQGDGDITPKRWRIPHEALMMDRSKRGHAKGSKYRTKKDIIRELRAELADFNERHNALMEQYAGATGRCDRLEHELEHKDLIIEAQKAALKEMEARVGQLESRLELNETKPALKIGQREL